MSGRILFVASNPTETKFDFVGELAAIRASESSAPDSKFNLVARWSMSVEALQRAIAKSRPDIVHVLSPGVDEITHAMVLSTPDGQPEYAQPEAFAQAFARAGTRAPKLVVLNTCHSHLHARAVAPYVGCVIAMDGIIYDRDAVEFTRQLYAALAHGETVQSAFDAARTVFANATPPVPDVSVLVAGHVDAAALTFASPARRATTRAAANPAPADTSCAKIFCSYSHKDEKYRQELETHLKLLERQGAIHAWHDRQIQAGEDWAKKIDDNIDSADLVLLLVSADFIASEYCYGIETTHALARAKLGKARVVPILVRDCYWKGVPFADLQWLPTGAKPVKKWTDRDSAWTDVATGISKIVASPASRPAGARR